MIDKEVATVAEAVADIFDGATMMVGGFGEAGSPIELIHALIDQGTKNLTVVNNNTGSGHVGLAALIENRQAVEVFLREKLGVEVFSARLYVMEGIPAQWDPGQATVYTALAVIVGLLFTAGPALRAATLSPTGALRYE